ncbi:PAN domain containing protein [Ditylenchus destructor]|uniref:PAN domain containing protein n=1 Tax=Ditylenchus destructor TaxID=166010 RepID=A0AAD4NH89_9BILA|nr:PAN domain containing protein [Ditylenchus destructor]
MSINFVTSEYNQMIINSLRTIVLKELTKGSVSVLISLCRGRYFYYVTSILLSSIWIGMSMTIIYISSIFAIIMPQMIKALSSNCFYLPNIALNGGTYDEFPATEIKYCCMACAKDPCCIAYTFDKLRNRCFMKAAISDSYKTSTMTSGLKANTHAGQGSMLKNIRIYGGAASAVKLPNSEECLQFCTAYGIFSWSPPRENTDETNGECSCMSRISSLEYSFGSKSAIFPPVSNLN